MSTPGPSIEDLWLLAAQQYGLLKRYILRHTEGAGTGWHDPAIRRMALQGLTILTAMIRRLIHLLALGVVLPPLRPRAPLAPLARPTPARAMQRGLRLTQAPRECSRGTANPEPAPDTPGLARLMLLERLAVLAATYRRRHSIARRIARRVQSARQSQARKSALPLRLRARIPQAAVRLLDHIDDRIRLSARAPP